MNLRFLEKNSLCASFARDWSGVLEPHPPLGYILRRDLHTPHVRFHALPRSKRYATTPQEEQIILQRAQSLLGELFGDASELWVCAPSFGSEGFHAAARAEIITEYGLQRAFRWRDPVELPEDQFDIDFLVGLVENRIDRFDDLFKHVADDIGHALLFCAETKKILAPYDGGFDIFASDPEFVQALTAKFEKWLPDPEDR